MHKEKYLHGSCSSMRKTSIPNLMIRLAAFFVNLPGISGTCISPCTFLNLMSLVYISMSELGKMYNE